MAEPLQVWCASAGIPRYTARAAQRAEAEGFDGFGLVDSQNLAGDPYVELALAAGTTERLLLGTAVTNPYTRHPAAAATAIATVHAESSGRAVLGIGRGDSALAHLGLAPAPVAYFERYVERLQGYLAGDDVPFDTPAGGADGTAGIASSDALGMAGGPSASRLHWIARLPFAKVPVDIAASGPKVIAVAARLAERITFAVGADPDRVAWAIDTARAARRAAGGAPDDLALGAYVPVFVHPDRATARTMIAGGVASYARFSVMHGAVNGPAAAPVREALGAVHDTYDMGHHFTHDSPQSAALTDDTIDAFGIAGPAAYCIERIQALTALGLTKLFVLGAGINLDRDAARASHRAFVEHVLPALR
jgi:5,10-methylenetetrahydromethanopterin reductase